MCKKEELQAAVKAAQLALDAANAALESFEDSPENNVFDSLDAAESRLEDKLRDKAFKDCEGAGNRGAPEYTIGFTVAGVVYIGTLEVEYNRHDKKYYYIECAKFTSKPVESSDSAD